MGEKIRVLSQGKVVGTSIEIEINKPHARAMEPDIHVQTEFFRCHFGRAEYVRLALTLLQARENLVFIKGIHDGR